MRSNPKFPADLATFPEEILNEKLYFCAAIFTTIPNIIDETFYAKNC